LHNIVQVHPELCGLLHIVTPCRAVTARRKRAIGRGFVAVPSKRCLIDSWHPFRTTVEAASLVEWRTRGGVGVVRGGQH
jgi:hypothetical protein